MASLFDDTEVQKSGEPSADDRRRADNARRGASLHTAMNAFAPTARKGDAASARHVPSSLIAGQLDRVEDACRDAGAAAHAKFTGTRRKMDVIVPAHVAALGLPVHQAETLALVVKADEREHGRRPIDFGPMELSLALGIKRDDADAAINGLIARNLLRKYDNGSGVRGYFPTLPERGPCGLPPN